MVLGLEPSLVFASMGIFALARNVLADLDRMKVNQLHNYSMMGATVALLMVALPFFFEGVITFALSIAAMLVMGHIFKFAEGDYTVTSWIFLGLFAFYSWQHALIFAALSGFMLLVYHFATKEVKGPAYPFFFTAFIVVLWVVKFH